MDVDKKRLRRLLQEIHDEVDRSDSMDERERARLQEMEKDIRRKLEEQEEGNEGDDTGAQIQETIDRLEVTHPRLTMMLSELMNILSNSGI